MKRVFSSSPQKSKALHKRTQTVTTASEKGGPMLRLGDDGKSYATRAAPAHHGKHCWTRGFVCPFRLGLAGDRGGGSRVLLACPSHPRRVIN